MNKELNIGDYVRTKKGEIAKYLGFEKDKYDTDYNKYLFDGKIYWYYEYYNEYVYEEDFEDWLENEVIKSSPSIIDLIEVGDYVNGKEVLELKNFGAFNGARVFGDIYFNEDIKSIVTHELFESLKYKIGE